MTALERYLQCPARYAWRHVLGIEAVREYDPELDALRRGSVVHEILDAFVRQRQGRPLRGTDREAAAVELHAVAVRVFDRVEREGGTEAALLHEQRRRWLEGLVDDAPAAGTDELRIRIDVAPEGKSDAVRIDNVALSWGGG